MNAEATGGGDGSIGAHLDNVYTATDEGDVTLFHNFDGETSFDLAKWLVAGMGTAHVVPGD